MLTLLLLAATSPYPLKVWPVKFPQPQCTDSHLTAVAQFTPDNMATLSCREKPVCRDKTAYGTAPCACAKGQTPILDQDGYVNGCGKAKEPSKPAKTPRKK